MSKRILIVDDDLILASLLKLTLELEGYEARTAAEGAEGLRMVAAERFDLVVLDLIMPNVDGVRFLRMLNERDEPRPTVMVLSSAIDEGMTDGWRALGVADIARKPVEPAELVARARRILEGSTPA